jgi:hypothetical protein
MSQVRIGGLSRVNVMGLITLKPSLHSRTLVLIGMHVASRENLRTPPPFITTRTDYNSYLVP